jgi:hypothetical protein
MSIVSDICQRMANLASERAMMETHWQEIATLAFPDHQDFYGVNDTINLQYSNAIQRGRRRFDDTAVQGVNRLAAVLESLATPQNELWHGLASIDPFAEEPTDEEQKWYDKVRDYQFRARYGANCGFMNANQRAIRSMVGFGTGVVFMEEGFGKKEISRPVLYQWVPLNEAFLAVNAQGEVDTLYRRFTMTARQMVDKFGEDRVAGPVLAAAKGNEANTKRFNIIHAVQPRQKKGRGNSVFNADYESIYVDRDNNHLIDESGFFEFPYLIYHWQAVGRYPYSESPVMLAYSDIKGLNAIRKAHMKGTTQFFDPTLGAADDDGLDRLNMTPGEINYGWLDPATGKPKAAPIITDQRPDLGQQVIEAERQSVNQSLYIDMFQALAENPDMTATQSMIVAQQKAQLLGPAGGKIQQTMYHEVERMIGILTRKGAFAPGAALEPPQSLQGRDIGARFTSPFDRLRLASEGIGLERAVARAVQIAPFDPTIMDEFNWHKVLRFGAKVDNAPSEVFSTPDESKAKADARAQQQQAAQMMAMLQQGGQAAKDIVPALGQAAQLAQNGGAPPAQ